VNENARKRGAKNQMSEQNQTKRLVVHLPKSLFSKVEEAASRDYTSVSDITRRALASDLRERGLLGEDEGMVIA
jgi:metal-responsive CopG/Arc/MetJ family transcriptional regulator